MKRTFLIVVTAGLAAAGAADAAKVLAYARTPLPTFDKNGQPLGRKEVGALPRLPAEIVGTLPNGAVGLKVGAETIYFRPIDVTTDQSQAVACEKVASTVRAPGAVVAGSTMGNGAAANCMIK